MDAATDTSNQCVVLMFASQTGKTEILNNVVGYFIDADPAPQLVVQPTIEFGEAWSKERLVPMVRDTPRLKNLVKENKSRDSGNTILLKHYPGGNIAICGANAPTGLAGRPRRVVLLDEVDRFPMSAGAEGDPCSLAIRRTESFWNAVVYFTSTPTIRGASRIESEFDQTDKRHWFVPCPKCKTFQTLKWKQVKWDGDDIENAYYLCEHCDHRLNDADRLTAIKFGRWESTAPFTGKRGYFLNGIYSPFRHKSGFKSRLHQMVKEFLDAKKGGKSSLKTWVNTFLAETWNDEAERIEATALAKRREDYLPTLPSGVAIITAGVDVQKDRLCILVTGWGEGEESWGLAYKEIPGNTGQIGVWNDLDAYIQGAAWKNEAGIERKIVSACVDSSAYTDDVYLFCRRRFARRIYAVKGSNQSGQPIASAPRRGNRLRCPVFTIGTDTAKGIIHDRLSQEDHGPGYMHFTSNPEAGFNDTFFQMLTAEELRTKKVKGFTQREWHKTRPRNEALDCQVYALAALKIEPTASELIKSIARSKQNASPKPKDDSNETAEPEIVSVAKAMPPVRKPFKQSSWVNGWRRF